MDIGATIRAIRKRKNITIAQICDTTGLSQGFMSQVETNKTSPSISTLENIAQALKVPLAYLLLKKEERMQIVRKDERRITTSGAAELKVEHLSSTQNVRMSIVEFPPGAMIGDAPMRMKDRRSMLSLKEPSMRSKGKMELNLLRVIPLAGMPAPPFRQKYGRGHCDCANLHLH